MAYKILVDFHHGYLYGSLKMLFEDRLGFEMYRPIGLDWFTQGYFKVAEPYGNAQDTIDQYLAIDDRPYDSMKSLNGNFKLRDNVYHIYDPENDITHKAITFNTFKEMEFDIILASHPLHECWEGLLQYQKKAKFVMQLGNDGQKTSAQNVLSSVWATSPEPHQNFCYYHQEFPLKYLGWSEPKNNNRINSFVHLLPQSDLYHIYKSSLPDFDFHAYGIQCPDGIPTKQSMINIMKDSTFGWHVKPADGYGHLLHQWYACGRPVITRGDYYLFKTGGMLLTDGETCIDLDRHTFDDNIKLIRYWSEPENNLKMCLNAMDRFRSVCDFNLEAERIKIFLSNIL